MDLNTDRVCEACGADWRGSVECPICDWVEPTATYAYLQPGFEELPPLAIYTVHGGAYDRSSVSAATLLELGIEVPHV